MSRPFQPLGFGLHGVQVKPFREEQSDMSKLQDACTRVLAAMQDAGGMLTSAQVREELADVQRPLRYAAIARLTSDGLIAAEGSTNLRVYSLIRPGAASVLESEVQPASAGQATPEPTPVVARTDAASLMLVPSVGSALLAAPTTKPPAADYAMRERLDAIADDLQDALEDACSAQMTHDLLAHLVAASGALRKARKSLPAA